MTCLLETVQLILLRYFFELINIIDTYNLKAFKKPDFSVKGLKTICGAGDSRVRSGAAIYIYSCNISMKDRYVYVLVGSTL